jgi:membrane protein
MRRTLSQIRAYVVENVPMGHALSRRAQAGIYLVRLVLRILKQWAHDRCPQQAAALAFQTALSLVPVLAIGFSLLRASGSLEAEGRLLEFIGTQILPDLADVTESLQSFSAKISAGAAGAGGLLVTIIACYVLYSLVDKIFNDIWRVAQRRTLMRKFLTFYALVTLLPVLAAFSLYWSGKLVASGTAPKLLVPLLIQFAAFLLTNKLLPYTLVTWRAAFAGALVTAVSLEALKWGFVTFAKKMLLAYYHGVYGAMGLVPLVLVWIYMSWLLILVGVETAHALQNQRLLDAEDRRQGGQEPINALVAAQLLAAVAADYERGGKGLTREALSTEFALSVEVVERISARLKASGLIAEVQGDKQGFIPARTPSSITMEQVLAAFRATDLATAEGKVPPRLATLVADLESARNERIAGVTISDLIAPAEQQRPL